MTRKKVRPGIPDDLAAKVLFLSDRTCCVCRKQGKPIQIHHIDEDPSNNTLENLSVLCLDCHNETMIKGGFGRKLNTDQVILYRDDWLDKISRIRDAFQEKYGNKVNEKSSYDVELATSIAEIYRENEEFQLLAMHYDILGNDELRDKYIEIALAKSPSDQSICYLRALQKRPDLIPKEVIDREIHRYENNKDFLQKARLMYNLGWFKESITAYITGIQKSIAKGNFFSAGFYLKEFNEKKLVEGAFEIALQEFTEKKDLWWQIRAMEELGWYKEIDELVLANADEIEKQGNGALLIKLAKARGEVDKVKQLTKKLSAGTRTVIAGEEDDEKGKRK